tara:strand:+ start:19 stop:507 length:489 start_codon:yes stop_codon:yes gene_type:complete
MSETETKVTPSATGRVKWFNNKAGYGFITVTSGEHENEDVFTHHTAIIVDNEQYRYLVQGEYVTFELCEVMNNDHKWQAGNVKGINGGKLMCETRLESRESRETRTTFSGENSREVKNYQPRVRTRGTGPRGDTEEWMLVRRKRYDNDRNMMRPRTNRPSRE